jgi:hypothetical protein
MGANSLVLPARRKAANGLQGLALSSYTASVQLEVYVMDEHTFIRSGVK